MSSSQLSLKSVGLETKRLLPQILAQILDFDATDSALLNLEKMGSLEAADCPGFCVAEGEGENAKDGEDEEEEEETKETAEISKGTRKSLSPKKKAASTPTPLPPSEPARSSRKVKIARTSTSSPSTKGTRIRVVNEDTIDAALALTEQPVRRCGNPKTQGLMSTRVLVLNLASDIHPGGAWLGNSPAQEEALCRRSSLSLSLHQSHYPLGTFSAIYSPEVLVIRESAANGHTLLDIPPAQMPVISVLSIAALKTPPTKIDPESSELVFAKLADRQTTKDKMRLVLTAAAQYGHRRLVLGALGCGIYGNPPVEIARCWREVLTDDEFRGGWWEEVVFAVFSKGGDGTSSSRGRRAPSATNFDVFEQELSGLIV